MGSSQDCLKLTTNAPKVQGVMMKYGKLQLKQVKNGSFGLYTCKAWLNNYVVERVEEDATGYHKGVFWNIYIPNEDWGDIDDLNFDQFPTDYKDCWVDSTDRLKDCLQVINEHEITNAQSARSK